MNRREKDRREAKRTSAHEWGKRPSIGGFESTCIRPPEGLELIKLPSEGVVKWDFLPYRVGQYNRRADPGMEHFELEYEAHRVPTGSGNSLYVCTQKMLNKPCAVCDWLRKHGGAADPELVKQLRQTTTRHLWLVNDKPGDPKNKLKIFDSNHRNKQRGFGEQMAVAVNTLDRDVDPFSLKDGYTSVLTCVEETFPGGKYSLASRIDFRPRKYTYPESILDDTEGVLDNCLIIPDYDELSKLLTEGPSVRKERRDRDDRDERNGDRHSKNDSDDDDDSDGEENTAEELGIEVGTQVRYRGKDYEVVWVSRDGSTVNLKDDDDNERKGINPNALEKVEDDEGPAKKSGGGDDEEDDEEAKDRDEEAKGRDQDDQGDGDEDGDTDEYDRPPAKSKQPPPKKRR